MFECVSKYFKDYLIFLRYFATKYYRIEYEPFNVFLQLSKGNPQIVIVCMLENPVRSLHEQDFVQSSLS